MFRRGRNTRNETENKPKSNTEEIEIKTEIIEEKPKEATKRLSGRAKYTGKSTLSKLTIEEIKVEEPVKHPTYKAKKNKVSPQIEPILPPVNKDNDEVKGRYKTYNRRQRQTENEDNSGKKNTHTKGVLIEKVEGYTRKNKFNKPKEETENTPSKETVVVTKIETTVETNKSNEKIEKPASEEGSSYMRRRFFGKKEKPDEKESVEKNFKTVIEKEIVVEKPVVEEVVIEKIIEIKEEDKKPEHDKILVKTVEIEKEETEKEKPEKITIIQEKPVESEIKINKEIKNEFPVSSQKLSNIKETKDKNPLRSEERLTKEEKSSKNDSIKGINDIKLVKVEKIEIREINEETNPDIKNNSSSMEKIEIQKDNKPYINKTKEKIKKEPMKEIKQVTITKETIVEDPNKNKITKKENNINNIKKRKKNSFKYILEQVEKLNMDKFLKDPFAIEIVKEAVKENANFKEEVFFPNAYDIKDNYKEFEVKPTLHRFTDVELKEIMADNPSMDELTKKYVTKSKKLNIEFD